MMNATLAYVGLIHYVIQARAMGYYLTRTILSIKDFVAARGTMPPIIAARNDTVLVAIAQNVQMAKLATLS